MRPACLDCGSTRNKTIIWIADVCHVICHACKERRSETSGSVFSPADLGLCNECGEERCACAGAVAS